MRIGTLALSRVKLDLLIQLLLFLKSTLQLLDFRLEVIRVLMIVVVILVLGRLLLHLCINKDGLTMLSPMTLLDRVQANLRLVGREHVSEVDGDFLLTAGLLV